MDGSDRKGLIPAAAVVVALRLDHVHVVEKEAVEV
jgi:hypothetical protein